MEPRSQVNYIYFAMLFVALTLLHGFHVILIDKGPLMAQAFFLVYAIGESFLEVTILMLIAIWIKAHLPKAFNSVFIILTFLLFIFHMIDFPMTRVMDWSVWYTMNFILQESAKNLKEMLYASNVTLGSWLIGGMVTFGLLFMGLIFFYFTERVVKKHPMPTLSPILVKTSCVVAVFLSIWDVGMRDSPMSLMYVQYEKALPWKTTIFPKDAPISLVTATLKAPIEEAEVLRRMDTHAVPLVRKPNIFLFITESLREDYILPEIAPNLSAFKKECCSFELSLSNANATHLSWFSIFHSRLPFYWSHVRRTYGRNGSVPLSILKHLGYQIHVYTSARLAYYQMDRLLFGSTCDLIDDFYYYPHEADGKVYASDEKTIDKLREDLHLTEDKEGHCFIVFLDSTHFDYSFPVEPTPVFLPIPDDINYIKLACSMEDVEGIKNRYLNAINYLDGLFGRFKETMKKQGLWDDALVIFTGDHGEEFYDAGHIFHASALSSAQTTVPIYYKFGHPVGKTSAMTSHVDIFPTIFYELLGKDHFGDLFDGEPIFNQNKWPYAISTRYNASRNPSEFIIHNGEHKLFVRFVNSGNIYKSKQLYLQTVKNKLDEVLDVEEYSLESDFEEAFKRIFPQ